MFACDNAINVVITRKARNDLREVDHLDSMASELVVVADHSEPFAISLSESPTAVAWK